MSEIIILAYLEEDEVVLKEIKPDAKELQEATEGMDIHDYVLMGGTINDAMKSQLFSNGEKNLSIEEIERRFKSYLKKAILTMQKNKGFKTTRL